MLVVALWRGLLARIGLAASLGSEVPSEDPPSSGGQHLASWGRHGYRNWVRVRAYSWPVRYRLLSSRVHWREAATRRLPYGMRVVERISAPLIRFQRPPMRTVADFDLPFMSVWRPVKKGRPQRREHLPGRPAARGTSQSWRTPPKAC
jgi:hypothetical protein